MSWRRLPRTRPSRVFARSELHARRIHAAGVAMAAAVVSWDHNGGSWGAHLIFSRDCGDSLSVHKLLMPMDKKLGTVSTARTYFCQRCERLRVMMLQQRLMNNEQHAPRIDLVTSLGGITLKRARAEKMANKTRQLVSRH